MGDSAKGGPGAEVGVGGLSSVAGDAGVVALSPWT